MRKPETEIKVVVGFVWTDWGRVPVEYHSFEVRRHVRNTLRLEPNRAGRGLRAARPVRYVNNRQLTGGRG